MDATLKVRAMLSFVQAADRGSFAGAARVLGVSAAAVSKNVAGLEAALGIRLMNRSTRSLQLTAEGAGFLEQAREALAALDAAVETVAAQRAAPAGRVRVSTSSGFGRQYLIPLLPAFYAQYPDIRLEIDFDDRRVDLVRDGYDLGLRGGVMPESSLITRHICRLSLGLVASPAYLAQAGVPHTPAELEGHRLIVVRFLNGRSAPWRFLRGNGAVDDYLPNGALVVSDSNMAAEAARLGLGIAQVAIHHAWPGLQDGSLKILMPDLHEHGEREVAVQYPHRALLAPRVRATVEFLVERLGANEALQMRPAALSVFAA